MDEKGFIFTIDAVLMLIPIFIIAATVSGLSLSVPHESPYYQAQDVMETLYNIPSSPKDPGLTNIANYIISGNIGNASALANDHRFTNILDKSGRKYSLSYTFNNTSGILVSNADMQNANNTASATRTYSGVTFNLYMW